MIRILKKVILAVIFMPFAGVMLYANDDIYEKLAGELNKYAVVYNEYSGTNYPVLSGNTAMGGLMDPLGRGIYNIEMNDLFLGEDGRVFGPGMMIDIMQFAGRNPESYNQSYSLENGILTTDAGYANGAYHSEMFFSQDDKDLMVYQLYNNGKSRLTCNINLGQFEMTVERHTNKSIRGISRKSSFTCLHYFLQSNITINAPALPDSRNIFVNVDPGKKLEIVLSLKVTAEQSPLSEPRFAVAEELKQSHIRKWKQLWQSLGVIILPDGLYARTFYRSLHWLQCTAGSSSNLPGECQFGTITSGIASAYQFHGTVASLNIQPWKQRPFTYGAAGWSLYAYTWLGDSERAGNMLAAHYRPEALRKNVTGIYPVGYHEFTYGGNSTGRYEYLSHDNPDAFCFAHEMLYDRTNHSAPPWDRQVHIQAFAPAMFYHYGRMYADMADTVYSVMRGAAEFWHTLLHYDNAQKSYFIPPLTSLTEDLFEANLLDALIAAKWTLTQAAALAEERNADAALRKQWKQIAKDIRIKDKNDVYLEFGGDDGARAGAGYQGIRGYAYLGFPTLETMRELSARKVNKSLDQCWIRNKKGKGMITFVANWFALTDAYWGRAEEAYEKSSYCLTQLDPSGTAMCEQN
ncbi:MAG: hypothetical protein LBK97_05515, partial [Prevotellaceae bacterium]|nr:hypothetical protein [Prevotellaceae bacterium]